MTTSTGFGRAVSGGSSGSAKLEACVKARGNSAFVIIARCDELYHKDRRGAGDGSLEHAIERGRAYVAAELAAWSKARRTGLWNKM